MTMPLPLDRDVSQAIRLARILSIFFTAYVHAWPGLETIHAAAQTPLSKGIVWVLTDLLGRGAVPLLSVVSGILAYYGLNRRPGRVFLTGKLRTLVVPMVIWNLIFLALLLLARLGGLPAGLPNTSWWNWVLALTAPPVNTPLGFLRDVFVCMVLALVLHPALRRAPGLALAFIAVIGAFIILVPDLLILRPTIFLLFAFGMCLARFDLIRAFSSWPACAGALAGLLALKIGLPAEFAEGTPLRALYHVTWRLFLATLFWKSCLLLLQIRPVAGVLKLETYVFPFFCMHLILLRIAGVLVEPMLTDPANPAFWTYFVLQPVFAFILAAILYEFGTKLMPGFMGLATGARHLREGHRPIFALRNAPRE